MSEQDSKPSLNDAASVRRDILRPKPYIPSEDFVLKFLKDTYKLEAAKLTRMEGFYDINYHIQGEFLSFSPTGTDGSNFEDIVAEKEGYFLKISNLYDSEMPGKLYAARALADHCYQKGICTQRAVRTADGNLLSRITVSEDSGKTKTYMASLSTFLPGKPLSSQMLTPAILFELGKFVAKVTYALQDFHHPFYDNFDNMWSLHCFPKLELLLPDAVSNEAHRKIISEILHAFNTQVVANAHLFRKAQTHGDIHEHNTLMTMKDTANSGNTSAASSSPAISGLIDFIDSARNHPVFEIATTIGNILMMESGKRQASFFDVPGHVLAGFNSHQPSVQLNSYERKALFICIGGRIVMLLVCSELVLKTDPENDYIHQFIEHGWAALEKYWTSDHDQVSAEWDKIAAS